MKFNKVILLRIVYVLFTTMVLVACGEGSKKETIVDSKPKVTVPDFNKDSAYYFVKKQVEFGPRVPNTKAHYEAGEYFIKKLEGYGATVITQDFTAQSFDGKNLNLRNIIASFYPEKSKRILLAAHWDSRPFADKDTERQNEPIDGANDGASGVAVLLEIARAMSSSAAPNVGIDLIFFDGEDWGDLQDSNFAEPNNGYDSWWCLGSQYWSKNKHQKNYSAYYGILLDMVGAKNAQFHMEELSMNFAPSVVEKVWNQAASLGFSQYFVKSRKPAITDDHAFVNQYAKIPMIDIVHYDSENGYFGDFHHTHKDNMDIISKQTLEAVGETVLHVLYNE